jgi:zinc and cadmium transporter
LERRLLDVDPLGVSTAIAIAAHEIPQEIGDFAILLHAGYSRERALLLNVLSALASVAGALGAFLALTWCRGTLPYFLVIAARRVFLYVAMARSHPRPPIGDEPMRASLRQIVLIALASLRWSGFS